MPVPKLLTLSWHRNKSGLQYLAWRMHMSDLHPLYLSGWYNQSPFCPAIYLSNATQPYDHDRVEKTTKARLSPARVVLRPHTEERRSSTFFLLNPCHLLGDHQKRSTFKKCLQKVRCLILFVFSELDKTRWTFNVVFFLLSKRWGWSFQNKSWTNRLMMA